MTIDDEAWEFGKCIQMCPANGWYTYHIERNPGSSPTILIDRVVAFGLYENGDIHPIVASTGPAILEPLINVTELHYLPDVECICDGEEGRYPDPDTDFSLYIDGCPRCRNCNSVVRASGMKVWHQLNRRPPSKRRA